MAAEGETLKVVNVRCNYIVVKIILTLTTS